ncbi:MAG: hypothetical protein ABIG86_02075 [Patescibacteria group bacterium]
MSAIKIPLVLLLIAVLFLCHPRLVLASDTVAPVSSLTLDPSSPDGLEDWYLQTVLAKIISSDLESGVLKIYHKLNQSPWEYKTFSGSLNTVINPSFEDDLSQSWQLVGDDPGFVDREIYFDGERSVNIVATNILSETCWENALRYIPADPWDTINSSLYLKTDNVMGTGAYFKIYTKFGEIKTLIGESTKVTGTANWQILSKSVVLGTDDLDGVYLSLCLWGSGKVNFDSVYSATVAEEISNTVNISSSGLNTLSFYAQDNALNLEDTKTATVKIDTKTPSPWSDFKIGDEKGNDHSFAVFIKIADADSGLKKGYEKFQYSVDGGVTWGYYSNLDKCSGNFVNNGWVALDNISYDGANEATLETPVVNYCNSAWKTCKSVRFFVRDVAGRDSLKDICINGPWFRTENASIYANGAISQGGGGADDTASGLIISGTTVSNVSSGLGIILEYYKHKTAPLSFVEMLSKTKNVLTVSSFPRSSGAYLINNDLTIGSNTVPSEVKNGSAKVVVFVKGDLTVGYDIDLASSGAIVFIVAGDVDIARTVTKLDVFIVADGSIDTTYNGNSKSDSILINGGLVGKAVNLSRQISSKQATDPAEDIVWNPNHLLYLSEILGVRKVVYKEL